MPGERTERKFPGHFICASYCRWFRTTDVNGWRVSSVGDMHSPPRSREIMGCVGDEPEEVGHQRLYESMVFPLGNEVHVCPDVGCEMNGVPLVAEWREVDCRGYQTQDEAEAGHESLVAEYADHPAPEGAKP